MENQQENQNETEPKQKETVKFNGISHQINLGKYRETCFLLGKSVSYCHYFNLDPRIIGKRIIGGLWK